MEETATAHHVEVYRRPGRFAGWPANYGMWAWGDELVLAFTCGHLSTGTAGFHAVDGARGFTTVQMRSLDGGMSWAEEPFTGRTPSPYGLSVDEHLPPQLRIPPGDFRTVPGSLNLADPAVAVLAGRTGTAGDSVSWLHASPDRCRSWHGPLRLPSFGLPGVSARTDRVLLGPDELLLLLTGSKSDGNEGCVIAAHSGDGGRTFELRGRVGDEPAGYRIMPATVRLPGGVLLTAARCSGPERPGGGWIEIHRSTDEGRTWRCIAPRAAHTGRGGNPPTLTLLENGRLCLIYGYRDVPFGIRARLSDSGESWGAEIVLREDGGCHDLGYPRTVRRADGALVTAYYYADAADGERYIAATIWNPA